MVYTRIHETISGIKFNLAKFCLLLMRFSLDNRKCIQDILYFILDIHKSSTKQSNIKILLIVGSLKLEILSFQVSEILYIITLMAQRRKKLNLQSWKCMEKKVWTYVTLKVTFRLTNSVFYHYQVLYLTNVLLRIRD